MALDIPVYDLNAAEKKLPTGCVFTRASLAWVVKNGLLEQLAIDVPMWDQNGLVMEDASTNVLPISQLGSSNEMTNASLFSFRAMLGMRAGVPALEHAAKGSNVPCREVDDPLADNVVALTCGWALVEMMTSVYLDVGFRDTLQNWQHRARWSSYLGQAYPLPSDRQDMVSIGGQVASAGPNARPIILLGAVAPSGADGRMFAIAPTGDYQNHLAAVVHHLQVEALPGPSSPIVTTGGAVARERATAVAAIQDPGAAETTAQIRAVMPRWMGRTQVIWQMDSDSDADAVRVALERTAAGRLRLVCAGAELDLGVALNGESIGVAFKVAGGTMTASRDGAAVVTVAARLPGATRERWGHGYAAGSAFFGSIARSRRWLSIATSAELQELSADALALPGDTTTTTAPALYSAEFSKARVPPALLENAVVPSSGNAALRLSYAGAGTPPRYVYRKGRSVSSKQELPWHKGRRVENKWTSPAFSALYSGDGVAPTITTGRPDAFGGSTAVRIQASRVTQDASNYSGAAVSFAEGALAPVGGLVCVSYFARANGTPCTVFFSGGANSGGGASIAIGNDWVRVSPGMASPLSGIAHNVQILAYYTASLAIDIDVCGIQIEDLTGVVQAAPSEYVDPTKIYNGGCAGVRWFAETCGNTIDGSYRVIEAAGAALPQPMGMQWQPAATNIQTYSPPNTGDPGTSEVTFAAAPAPVAGLPAIRLTATGSNYLHAIDRPAGSPFSGPLTARLLFRKSATARPHLFLANGTWYNYILPNSDYSAVDILLGTSHNERAGIKPLGDDCFEMWISGVFAGESSPAAYFRMAKDDNTEVYAGSGEYIDVAAFDVAKTAYTGTPLLGVNEQTARGADNPASGLPAIGTGPFTAFVDITVICESAAGIEYPKLFTSNSNGGGILLYYVGTVVYFYGDGTNNQDGFASITVGARQRFAFRRKADGTVSLFVNGAKTNEVLTTPYNATTSPRFSGEEAGIAGYIPNAIRHLDRLIYSALSDAECVAMTTL